jgi:hypothetical protein
MAAITKYPRLEIGYSVEPEIREIDPGRIPPVSLGRVEEFLTLYDQYRIERGVLRVATGQFLPWPEDGVSHLTFSATTD